MMLVRATLDRHEAFIMPSGAQGIRVPATANGLRASLTNANANAPVPHLDGVMKESSTMVIDTAVRFIRSISRMRESIVMGGKMLPENMHVTVTKDNSVIVAITTTPENKR